MNYFKCGTPDDSKVDWESENILGAKNLNSYPYNETTKTTNGITFTDNGDGTITASGIASADAQFLYHGRLNTQKNPMVLPNGNYIINGLPAGSGSTTYYMVINRTYNGSFNAIANNYSGDTSFTLNGDDYSADSVTAMLAIVVKSGTNLTTPITIKAMIRPATVKDDSYAEYALTNKAITNRIDCTQTTAGTYVLKATVDANGVATYSWVSE